MEYIANDLIASQIVVRFLARDGQSAIACICYDFSVAILRVPDSGVEDYIQRQAHSITMNRRVGSKKEVTFILTTQPNS